MGEGELKAKEDTVAEEPKNPRTQEDDGDVNMETAKLSESESFMKEAGTVVTSEVESTVGTVVLPAADVVGVVNGVEAGKGESKAKEASEVVVSKDHGAEDVEMTSQADESQSKEKHESAGTAVACEDKDAVGSDGGRPTERTRDESGSGSPKAEEEEIVSEHNAKDRVDNMELENEPLQQQALADSLARMSGQAIAGEGQEEKDLLSAGSASSLTSPLSPKPSFKSSGLLSLGSVEFAGSLRVHAFYVMHCMYTQYSGSIACACN